jgi:hypothetical protein
MLEVVENVWLIVRNSLSDGFRYGVASGVQFREGARPRAPRTGLRHKPS